MPPEPRLTPELITADLETSLLPSAVLCYEQLGSTMDIAREHARAGAAEGLLVLAEEQTAGRGRMGRSWFAPSGSALLSSLLLRPYWLSPTDIFELTMLAAISLCAAIEEITPLRPVLKWPNDVLLDARCGMRDAGEGIQHSAVGSQQLAGEDARRETRDARREIRKSVATDHRSPITDHRSPALTQHSLLNTHLNAKVAGILIDLEMRGGKIAWAIVGCGVNVHSHPPFGPEQPYPATSLDAALGQRVERLELLRALLCHLDANYEALRIGGGDALFEDWRRRLITLGKRVRVATPTGTFEGVAEGVARSGALLVRDAHGELHTVTAGDVAQYQAPALE